MEGGILTTVKRVKESIDYFVNGEFKVSFYGRAATPSILTSQNKSFKRGR